LPQKTYAAPAARLAFFEELERRLAGIPGVTEAALCNRPPITPKSREWVIYTAIEVAGQPEYKGGTGGTVTLRTVTPRYFAALGIPVRGRAFEEADRDPSGAAVILSDRLARRLFPGEEPLGHKLRDFNQLWLTVVGVAANVKNNGLVEPDAPELYRVRKHSADGVDRSAIALVRTALDQQLMARQVRRQVSALDPTLPLEVVSLQQRVERLAQRPRFNAVLLGIFAGLGLVLAAIGLYGLISFLVARRTQEIGVRMALGATRGEIFALVLKQAVGWVAAGAAAGLVGAFFATRFIESLLFGVSGKDPWTLAAAMAVLFAVALLAAWIPARHAAAVDPVEALRQE
jgi:predicted permease